MARSTDLYRISIRGAGRRASQFSRAARAIQDDVNREIRLLGRETTAIFAEGAPRDTTDLARSIRAVPFFGRAARPRVSIRIENLHSHGAGKDIDYSSITRFGHKQKRIVPRQARALKVHPEGHRNQAIYYFRASVAGVGVKRPVSDWVVPATQRARRAIDRSERRLARKVETRILR